MSLLRLLHRQAGGAILGILLTLLLASADALPLHAQESGTTIVFYAQPKVSEDLWPALISSTARRFGRRRRRVTQWVCPGQACSLRSWKR